MFEEMDKKKVWIGFLIITNVLSLAFILYTHYFDTKEEVIVPPQKMMVQIAGEVNHPEVYELEQGTRLKDLIALAGGFTNNADQDTVNLALALDDGMKITIPTKVDEESCQVNDKVNINTADIDELITLNGIGEAKAQAIIDFREQFGAFKTIDEIQFVPGIGEKTYEQIKDNIYC